MSSQFEKRRRKRASQEAKRQAKSRTRPLLLSRQPSAVDAASVAFHAAVAVLGSTRFAPRNCRPTIYGVAAGRMPHSFIANVCQFPHTLRRIVAKPPELSMAGSIILIVFGLAVAFVNPFTNTPTIIFGLVLAGIGGFRIYRRFSRRRLL